MTTTKQYASLDNIVYDADALKLKKPIRSGKFVYENYPKNGGQKYQVLKTVDTNDTKNSHGYDTNGFQGMAMAPIDQNGDVDYTQITVAYAGTNFSDRKDVAEDLQGIGAGNRKNLMLTNEKSQKYITASQFDSALKFYQQVQTKYPNATLDTTGHSLGGAIALLVGSHYHVSATVFSAPDPWNAMTNTERLWALAHPESLRNYRHQGDLWSETDSKTLGIDGFTGKTVWCQTTASGMLKNHNTHMLSTFKFNQKGQAKQLKAQMENDIDLLDEKQSAIKKLVKSLKKSGGTFTHAEKIAVDAVEAIAMADSLNRIAGDGIGQIIKQYHAAIEEFEPLWQQTIKSAALIGAHLSDNEVIQALEAGGVRRQTVVDEPTQKLTTKIDQAQAVGQEYLALSANIKLVVDQMLATDQELAGMFG
ncbi:lipase family protein [Latilactobacillus fuchuensis]|uniref:lipase family protein n=1 Tax=Latilactobacillus fuchuensis TaxID=164393 RepID=UPI0020C7E087|nr:hypothetical protein [Latilactobacillus fuchuensis]MCP8858319.1 hypothetical protein [Latilactobacillus fuchuensis]